MLRGEAAAHRPILAEYSEGLRRELGGNPSDLLLNDRALLVDSVLWMLALLGIIYSPAWGLDLAHAFTP